MKKIVLITLLIGFYGFSQNRTNDELPVISKNIGQLAIAKGWLKNSSGQWIGRNNKIISDLGADTKVLENYEKYSVGTDNFISFEIKNIKIKDSSYVLLLKKYRDGFYDYETIERGWNPKNSCKYYIISNDELNKVRNVSSDSINNLYISIKYKGDIKYIDLKTFTNNSLSNAIIKEVKENDRNDEYGSEMLAINLYRNKTKNIVQFYFYDTYRYHGESIKRYGNPGPENEDKYYETDFLSFNNFIKIN